MVKSSCIEIRRTRRDYHSCNVCGKTGRHYEVSFRDVLHNGTCITLCRSCLNKLKKVVDKTLKDNPIYGTYIYAGDKVIIKDELETKYVVKRVIDTSSTTDKHWMEVGLNITVPKEWIEIDEEE